ncbi:hypothetical protein I7I50_11605 [Histoplasma capsulatum G186AR]|uniref:Uncharacterized protein n=1 Tax=Ajellomyces capsulatus TaxID=5037 RepID=A0A8H7Z5U1_AJECA|nr:hypothetical protein I7I52_02842 [Histoplasma capsulatum]QSS70090.1 hypothetical protein I7I50_11605 [Histoplasma capsulatum G186AR]
MSYYMYLLSVVHSPVAGAETQLDFGQSQLERGHPGSWILESVQDFHHATPTTTTTTQRHCPDIWRQRLSLHHPPLS